MQSLIPLKSLSALIFALFIPLFMPAQNLHISGTVTDEFQHPLTGATVNIETHRLGTVTDRKGNFTLENLAPGTYILHYSFLGYQPVRDTVLLTGNISLKKKLCPANTLLNEVTVTDRYPTQKITASIPVDVLDREYLEQRISGSLMQTLNRLPGVSSMDIGSGQSKPVIRGLGFQRVVVAENNIRHEGQEWGADHGLEIDRFAVERIEIIKGPASLMYGAGAIGGVIDLKQIVTPEKNSFGGSILMNTQTNNDQAGISAKFHKRFNKLYIRSHFSFSNYSDYKVPTDSISYMTYYFPLKDNRLRNTAGRERSGSINFGYIDSNFSSHLSITDNWSKSGFFANAHGLEIRNSQIDYDRSYRDIDLPFQQVNHFKILSNSILLLKDYKLNLDLGFQHNYREEFSERVAHGYMPLPPDSLERLFDKHSLTANFKIEFPQHNRHQFTGGLSAEMQDNRSGGWGFLLPDFQLFSGGAFIYDYIRLTKDLSLTGGLRYDLGALQTESYTDWYASQLPDGTKIYTERSKAMKRLFGSLSWGAGAVHKVENTTLMVNIGKSFRMPDAKELSSNGINYHMYRHEKGNRDLETEESYQFDFGYIRREKKWQLEITPFVNYFPNYIYLNPTAGYEEALQIFSYNQSEVFRAGAEIVAGCKIYGGLSLSGDLEYIYSLQLSGAKKGYTLPFSPPLSMNIELSYASEDTGILKTPTVSINLRMVGAQNNIVPPEKRTAGYALVNLSAGTGIQMGRNTIRLNLQAINLLNTRYYDHTSFYRLIEVPGQGRNIITTLQLSL